MLYTQRNSAPPDRLRYDVPEEVRTRIFHAFRHVTGNEAGAILEEVEETLLMAYGGLSQSPFAAARASDNATVEHFFTCHHEQALDFIEAIFPTLAYFRSRGKNTLVELINAVFREHGVGYELTDFVETPSEERRSPLGMKVGMAFKVTYPEILKKSSQYEHEQIVKPALEVLKDPRFNVANAEMLKAHGHYRHGSYDDAITSCGSAFESVLKTICDVKGWGYDPDTDTLSKLVKICKDNGLFPGFYGPVFEGTGTVRNKLGDAHGRGPTPLYDVDEKHVEHLIQMTSAHILLVAKLAAL